MPILSKTLEQNPMGRYEVMKTFKDVKHQHLNGM